MAHKARIGTARAAKTAASSRPTIKDVAEKCGVHPSTVSRALSGAMSHLVAPEVAKRIRAAAAVLGYQPNVTAAGLRTGRSGLIGVLAPDIADPGFPPVLSGITETLGAQGYAIIVVDVGPDPSRERELVDRLIARGVDGLVLATVTLHDPIVAHCLAAAIPVVLVNRSDSERKLPAVVTDDQAGMRLAVEHLAGLGHVSIGHIAGPQTVSTGALRAAGFKAAAARAGLSAQDIAIEPARAYTREQGRLAALRLLDRKNAPTAIVAANDQQAFGVLQALGERGLRAPHDLSVIGFDDVPIASWATPPLTTIRQPLAAMAAAAFAMLRADPATAAGEPRHIELATTLVLRESTAPPPP